MDFSLTQRQQETSQRIRDYCRQEMAAGAGELDAAPVERTPAMTAARVRKLGESGLLGLGFPEGEGGSGGDLNDSVTLIRELGEVCPATALATLTSVGLCARALSAWGAGEGRQQLPALLRGEALGACGTQEPEADLDSWSARTVAVAAGGGFRLDGRKSMVVNAPLAVLTLVPAALAGNPALFLVAAGASGLTVSALHEKLGCRGAATADLALEGCPAVKLAAAEGAAAVAGLRSREHLFLAALAAGILNAAVIKAGVFARDHKAGDRPLARHQEISFKLADMFLFLDTAKMLIQRCVWLLDENSEEAGVVASGAKCFATESAARATGLAVQIMGQEGCKKGSPAERLYRDAKLLEILGDPSERHRMYIADQVLAQY